jgi:hypothetical protein
MRYQGLTDVDDIFRCFHVHYFSAAYHSNTLCQGDFLMHPHAHEILSTTDCLQADRKASKLRVRQCHEPSYDPSLQLLVERLV